MAQEETIGGYTNIGYTVEGYIVGDNSVPITKVRHFTVTIKESSTKTKAQTLTIAMEQLEARQLLASEGTAMYADVYDVRDKTITRLFSMVAMSAGFASRTTVFGGDIEQITAITNVIEAQANEAIATANNAQTQVNSIQSIRTPNLKLVNPFEVLMLDTQMTNDSGVYSFQFDTTNVGNGNYNLEIEFVERVL